MSPGIQGIRWSRDGESGIGINIPPHNRGQETAEAGHEGMEDSRTGTRVLPGKRRQSDGHGVVGGQQEMHMPLCKGTRRQQQLLVQPDRFPPFLSPFVAQFPQSPLPRAGMASRTWRGDIF